SPLPAEFPARDRPPLKGWQDEEPMSFCCPSRAIAGSLTRVPLWFLLAHHREAFAVRAVPRKSEPPAHSTRFLSLSQRLQSQKLPPVRCSSGRSRQPLHL